MLTLVKSSGFINAVIINNMDNRSIPYLIAHRILFFIYFLFFQAILGSFMIQSGFSDIDALPYTIPIGAFICLILIERSDGRDSLFYRSLDYLARIYHQQHSIQLLNINWRPKTYHFFHDENGFPWSSYCPVFSNFYGDVVPTPSLRIKTLADGPQDNCTCFRCQRSISHDGRPCLKRRVLATK